MNNMNNFDKHLIIKLKAIEREAEEIRASLFSWHGDCACSHDKVCAFHARTNNCLLDIVTASKLAQNNLFED